MVSWSSFVLGKWLNAWIVSSDPDPANILQVSRAPVKWNRPPIGFCKCNMDIFISHADHLMSFRAIVRDETGVFIIG